MQRGGPFRAGLEVRQLRVRHAAGGAKGQGEDIADLRAGGGQQALFRRAAAHGAGAQVRDKGPGADDGGGPWLYGVHIDQPPQALGPGLGDGAGQARRRGGPGLSRRQQQHRHAALHRHPQALQGVGGELQRRHHKAVGLANEGSRSPLGLPAGDEAQHFQGLLQVRVVGPAGSRVLGRSHDYAISGVEIHLVVVEDVPQHASALEHVDMLAGVGDARHVVQVLRRGIPVLARFPIGDHHRRAGRGEMHLAAAEGQIVFGFLPVQDQVPPGRFQGLLHHRPGHFQAAVGADDGADAHAGLQTVGRGLAEANLLQDLENIVADRRHSRV